MNQPEPQSLTFSSLINDIETGSIKIPQFQRDFVWSKQKSAKLLDSIVKGYPIGTFILWKTRESLRSVRNIGGAQLPPTPAGDVTQYVLDGQQRLTSLFASLKGLQVTRESKTEDFSEMYIDLLASEGDDIVIIDISGKSQDDVIKLRDLLYGGLTLLAAYPPTHLPKIEQYKTRIESYAFSAVLLKDAPINVATEVFTRLNVGGKPLSVFEIMVAKTFDAVKEFDLSEEYNTLIKKLRKVDYETLSEATVLQTISAVLVKECQKKHILGLKKKAVIDVWPEVRSAIESAVDYFRNFYRIPVSKLLPYNALVVPFAYFFYHHRDKPTGDAQRFLQDFFWRTSLSARYSSAMEGKVAQDIKRVDEILKGQLPDYDYPVNPTLQFIQSNGSFSAGRSFIKAILCLLAYQEPKSFIDNSIVRISNDWLKQANSKNYHHFFPQAYLRRTGREAPPANHIANITIVDDFLNKRRIRDKPPSAYMREFDNNDELGATMQTHLIDLDTFGVWDDNYEVFFSKRAEQIGNSLRKWLIPRDIDGLTQTPNVNDYEEAESEELL